MLFQRWSGVEELDVPRMNVVLIDSISLLGLQSVGEVLGNSIVSISVGVCYRQHGTFKKCQDALAVRGCSFVLLMSPYSLFLTVFPRVAALDFPILSV